MSKKEDRCGAYSIPVFLHPPRDNPNRMSNCIKTFPEVKKDGMDRTNRLKVDDIENLGEIHNLKLNVNELNEQKFLTELYLSKSMKKTKDKKTRQSEWHPWGHSWGWGQPTGQS